MKGAFSWEDLQERLDRLASVGGGADEAEMLAGRLRERSRRLAGEARGRWDVPDAPSLRFRVGAARLAVPARAVAAVGPLPRIAPWPNAPPSLLGLVVWRHVILPVLDVAVLARLEGGAPRTLVVLRGDEDGPIGLAVDSALSVEAEPDVSPGGAPLGAAPVIEAVGSDGVLHLSAGHLVTVARFSRAAGVPEPVEDPS